MRLHHFSFPLMKPHFIIAAYGSQKPLLNSQTILMVSERTKTFARFGSAALHHLRSQLWEITDLAGCCRSLQDPR